MEDQLTEEARMAISAYRLIASMEPKHDRVVVGALGAALLSFVNHSTNCAVHWSALIVAPDSGIDTNAIRSAMQPKGLGFAPIEPVLARDLLQDIEHADRFELRLYSEAHGLITLAIHEREVTFTSETPEPIALLTQVLVECDPDAALGEDHEDAPHDENDRASPLPYRIA